MQIKRSANRASERVSIKTASKRTFVSLDFRQYRKYATGTFVMNLGTWMHRIAQDWLILELTGSGVALGIITGLQFAPAIFFSFYGGSLGDRYNKKKILAICSAVISLSGLTLAAIVFTENQKVWIVYTFALVVGIFSAIDMPIRHSLMSDLVGEQNVSNAVSLNSVNFNLARIIGPAIAGITVSVLGVPASLFASSLAYAFFAVLILSARNGSLHTTHEVAKNDVNFFATLKFIWADKAIVKAMFIVATLAYFGLNFQITTALVAVNIFGLGAAGYGLLSSTTAIGALFGGLISAHRNSSVPVVKLAATALLFGVWQLGAGASPTLVSYAAMLGLSGLFALLTTIAANSLIQHHTPYAIRGKILGIYTVVFSGSMAIGGPAVGLFADLFGPQETLMLGGVSVILVSIVVILISLDKHSRNKSKPYSVIDL